MLSQLATLIVLVAANPNANADPSFNVDQFNKGPLYKTVPMTKSGTFTAGIEGPACDKSGTLFAVNFEKQQTIGIVKPDGSASLFVELPGISTGNGIRFNQSGDMFVADYKGHNVLKITPAGKISVFAHNASMNQPNDLAIAPNGTLYASDPNWSKGTGQLWRINTDGTVVQEGKNMGTTNGVEVSPDGKTLYVNESVQRKIWAFDIKKNGGLKNKRLLKSFDDHGFDGMRCDSEGNLYVTRYGKGTVVIISPKGEIVREVDVRCKKVSNICFGGPDGRTAYVTDVDNKRIVAFRVEVPGLSWKLWQR